MQDSHLTVEDQDWGTSASVTPGPPPFRFSLMSGDSFLLWISSLPGTPSRETPRPQGGASRQGKCQTGLRAPTPPARRGLRHAPPLRQGPQGITPEGSPGTIGPTGIPRIRKGVAARPKARQTGTGLPRADGAKEAGSAIMCQPWKSPKKETLDVARVLTLPLLEWIGWLPLIDGRGKTQVF